MYKDVTADKGRFYANRQDEKYIVRFPRRYQTFNYTPGALATPHLARYPDTKGVIYSGVINVGPSHWSILEPQRFPY